MPIDETNVAIEQNRTKPHFEHWNSLQNGRFKQNVLLPVQFWACDFFVRPVMTDLSTKYYVNLGLIIMIFFFWGGGGTFSRPIKYNTFIVFPLNSTKYHNSNIWIHFFFLSLSLWDPSSFPTQQCACCSSHCHIVKWTRSPLGELVYTCYATHCKRGPNTESAQQ